VSSLLAAPKHGEGGRLERIGHSADTTKWIRYLTFRIGLAWPVNVFIRRGQKKSAKKIAGIKSRSKSPGIGVGTSVAFATFMVSLFNTNKICFATFGEAHPALTSPVSLIYS